jgi:hypothetical protein
MCSWARPTCSRTSRATWCLQHQAAGKSLAPPDRNMRSPLVAPPRRSLQPAGSNHKIAAAMAWPHRLSVLSRRFLYSLSATGVPEAQWLA